MPQLDNLPKVQFQETIQLLSSLSFQLMETDAQQPFQFVVVSSKDMVTNSMSSNVCLVSQCSQGTVIVCLENDATLKNMFASNDVGAIEESFANGSSWQCAPCLGINLYLGPRVSHRPRQTVVCHQLHRKLDEALRQTWLRETAPKASR